MLKGVFISKFNQAINSHNSYYKPVPHCNISAHKLLNKTIRELGLTVIPFPLGYGASDNTLMYLRVVHMRYKDLGNHRTPYHLRPQERKPYNQLVW